jgi:hypothetical protein
MKLFDEYTLERVLLLGISTFGVILIFGMLAKAIFAELMK